MHFSRRLVATLAFALTAIALIVLLPLSSLAAPQAPLGTPLYLPVVLKHFPQTPTPTPTATATATATATSIPTATATPITPTTPITVGPVTELGEQFVFSPTTVTVHVGAVVQWTWATTGHTVTSGSNLTADNKFCSPSNTDCDVADTSSAGATFEHEFDTPGSYPYFCQIHGSFGMTGTIVVLP